MPLTFDWTETDFDKDNQSDVNTADCLVWLTMAVGINHITVENAREFYARASYYEKINGPYRYHIDPDTNQKVDDYFTPEDILRAVGLKTNASVMTKAKFYKHMWEIHERFNVPSSLDRASKV
jgi:hypothetical protein